MLHRGHLRRPGLLGVRRVKSSSEIERLQADVRYYHDRVALLRARLYRWGQGQRLGSESSNASSTAPNSASSTNVHAPRPDQRPASFGVAVGVVGREAACLGPAVRFRVSYSLPNSSRGPAGRPRSLRCPSSRLLISACRMPLSVRSPSRESRSRSRYSAGNRRRARGA